MEVALLDGRVVVRAHPVFRAKETRGQIRRCTVRSVVLEGDCADGMARYPFVSNSQCTMGDKRFRAFH
jgi:hypothetical protein